MIRLLVTRVLPEANLAAAREAFDTEVRDEPLSEDEAAAALGSFDAILPTLGDAFTARAFATAGTIRCRLLANFGVGTNHIDVAAARAHGVAVTNTPGAVTDATADIGMLLMLASCRRVGEGERLVRSGTWTGWRPTQMLGTHVTGKVLGVVGFGRIGQAVARRAHFGFLMPVIYWNRSEKRADLPARRVERLADLMAEADVVMVCLPGGPETAGLVGRAEIAAMRPTAHLVNIARGDVLDEEALVEALEEGRIAGAGLDVYAREPLVPERLRAQERAVLLPHLGTSALEVREAMGRMALDNLRAFAEGRALPNPV